MHTVCASGHKFVWESCEMFNMVNFLVFTVFTEFLHNNTLLIIAFLSSLGSALFAFFVQLSRIPFFSMRHVSSRQWFNKALKPLKLCAGPDVNSWCGDINRRSAVRDLHGGHSLLPQPVEYCNQPHLHLLQAVPHCGSSRCLRGKCPIASLQRSAGE